MSPIYKSLKRVRQAQGLSLRGLAAAAGITHRELIHIEQGTVDPRLSTVERLAKALGVPVEDLIHKGPAPRSITGKRARRAKR